MRRFQRPNLDDRANGNPTAAKYLRKKQTEIDNAALSSEDVRKKWDAARKTQKMGAVALLLRKMVGVRDRCMFCEDSRGTDIEHFWPLAVYHKKVFTWHNHLWICSGCNRKKGDRFDLDAQGRPLLVNPTVEDPWDFLVFDSATDIITARFDATINAEVPKGQYTCNPDVLPLNIESVTSGRGRQRRNLMRAVKHCIAEIGRGIDVQTAITELEAACQDNDAYGMLTWYFRREGQSEEPFVSLKNLIGADFDALGLRLTS